MIHVVGLGLVVVLRLASNGGRMYCPVYNYLITTT